MTVHASMELIWMTAGVAITDTTTFNRRRHEALQTELACGAKWTDDVTAYGFWIAANPVGARTIRIPHEVEVTCQRCLVAMDAAREGRVLD